MLLLLLALASCMLLIIIVFIEIKRNQEDKKKSLHDTRDYVKSKIELDIEDRKFSKLLESVIPRHLVGKLRGDLLNPARKDQCLFEPLYLDSYDNASILFADIVNFTSISSTCKPEELVQTLNELFGRFDERADARHCLRIKILGDCYYCVSGINDSDHAYQCVEMGLDMIDVLSELAQSDERRLKLAMRVGIHTGHLLCGILGKKRWQFEVYSNDVKLANHAEQSGAPGRVHITESTLKELDGRYKVEEAHGRSRDSYIEERNISTYFVIPPPGRRRSSLSLGKSMLFCPAGSTSAARQQLHQSTTTQQVISVDCDDSVPRTNINSTRNIKPTERNNKNRPEGENNKPVTERDGPMQSSIVVQRGQNHQNQRPQEVPEENEMDLEEERGGLSQTQVVRPDVGPINGSSVVPSGDKIQLTTIRPTTTFPLPSSSSLSTSLDATDTPNQIKANSVITMLVPGGTQTTLTTNSVIAPARPQPARFKQTSKKIMHAQHFISTIAAPFANLDYRPSQAVEDNMIRDAIKAQSEIRDINKLTLRFEDARLQRLYKHEVGLRRLLLGLSLHLCALVCFGLIIYSQLILFNDLNDKAPDRQQIRYEPNIISAPANETPSKQNSSDYRQHDFTTSRSSQSDDITIIGGIQSDHGLQSTIDTTRHIAEPQKQPDSAIAKWLHKPSIVFSILLMTLFIFTSLIYTHQVELRARRDFIWRQKAIKDREQMMRVRDCNRKIFFTILPEHVANYYLNRKHIGRRELYHRSYNLVGVVFASISNFDTFYYESEGNRNGLDCMRLLNEIICDFDTILEQERFKAIDKIKTIGTTYMAAIGLFPDNVEKLEVPDGLEQQSADDGKAFHRVADHLIILLNFINEIKKCLKAISDFAFNEYTLKVGVDLGPVTAGVVGAGKPQYDIWGNTVNVASRMESTCDPGMVQVTEDVYKYLKHRQDLLEFFCRGEIKVKGKGEMVTYYVKMLDSES